VDPALIEYAVRMVTATRKPEEVGLKELEHYIMFGASPRASINLILTARALAFVRGRDYVLPQDVLRYGARRDAPSPGAVLRSAFG
jgi:MoxR-like ATPase